MQNARTVFRGTALALILVAALFNGGCGCNNGGSNDGGRTTSPADYNKVVSLFTVSSIMLETDDKHKVTYLTKMTETAPDEPAGWANLGLSQLRGNQLKDASTNLQKAAELAPQNPGIEKLLALLAERSGQLPVAIEHYKKALEKTPDDIRARYALAQQQERLNTPEGDAEYQKEMQTLLDKQPDNLVVQLNLARIAAKRNDTATLQKMIGLLEARTGTFDSRSLDSFQKLKAAVAGGHARALDVQQLLNVLRVNIAFPQSFAALQKSDKEGAGEPIRQFIKLPPMPATPAAPDTGITFESAPLLSKGDTGKAGWAGVLIKDENGEQILLTADGKAVHLENGASLPFPGGPKAGPPGPNGILSLDMNYDLKNDLCFAGNGGVKLYQQAENGTFTDVTAKTGLPASVLSAAYTGAWGADIEADGDLDIVLGAENGTPTVLRNNGDGTWKAIHPFNGVSGLRDFAWADLDGDGSNDAALIDGQGKLHIFANQRAGLFRERPLPSGVGKTAALAAADMNNDGKLDLLALQADGTVLRISDKNQGTDWETAEIGRWASAPKDLAAGTARLMVGDLDNNGGLDVVASTPTAAQVWLCDDKNAYAPLPAPISAGVLTLADVTKDGRLDLIGLSPQGQPVRLVSKGTKNYAWQELRPRAKEEELDSHKNDLKSGLLGPNGKGSGDRRVNSFGIGSEIECRAGLLYQKQVVTSPVVHFGLGTYPSIDAIRILWANGDVRAEFAAPYADPGDAIPANQSVTLRHRLKGSCPFLFTWNGKEMQFVTDCIWRSPLGLRINAQDTAGSSQTEDWVKIRGDQLVPDADGMYDVRITAELWETHFFDHVSLLTVDHPAGTDIFVDERFAFPQPPRQVYVTGVTQPIKKAVDDNGTDVTEIVKERDGRHLDTFGRGEYQGVTRDHWVEIELGEETAKTAPLWLVCYGWVHPTDSSINVALGQGHNPPPQGLSLETPDAQGHWSVAKPGLGFPEGKVKTILINLDGVFKPGAPRKLRLRTNLEVYWDSIRWAAGQPQTPVKTQRLAAQTAELRYRGFSEVKAADASSPELPQSYEKLDSAAPQWRDLIGYCTRYGDILELLQQVDDRYVIMNAGDEMRLKFKAPPPPPTGWIRDYVLIGDGWEKDGDYNTGFSKTIMPLPYHGQKTYNIPPGRLEDDPAYRLHPQDWQNYHTRYITPEGFSDAFRPGK